MKTKFDTLADQLYKIYITEVAAVEADNLRNAAASNISPDLIKNFKGSVLMPLANKQIVDPNKMQEAIKAGVIEDLGNNVYTVSDAALTHVNQDPDLQGKFLPTQQAAADQLRKRQQQSQSTTTSAVSGGAPAGAAQNPTTTKTTSTPSTNRAGVVTSVYKLQ